MLEIFFFTSYEYLVVYHKKQKCSHPTDNPRAQYLLYTSYGEEEPPYTQNRMITIVANPPITDNAISNDG